METGTKRKGGRRKKSEGDWIARETLAALLHLTETRKRPPTRREVADACGLSSVATVIERLEVLRKRGLVDFEIGSVRSLLITEAGERYLAEPAAPGSGAP